MDAPAPGTTFYVNETQNITIECQANGLPAPTISLYTNSDSSRVILDSTSSVRQPSGLYKVAYSFTLIEAEDRDSGTLSCIAESVITELNTTSPLFRDILSFNLIVQSET